MIPKMQECHEKSPISTCMYLNPSASEQGIPLPLNMVLPCLQIGPLKLLNIQMPWLPEVLLNWDECLTMQRVKWHARPHESGHCQLPFVSNHEQGVVVCRRRALLVRGRSYRRSGDSIRGGVTVPTCAPATKPAFESHRHHRSQAKGICSIATSCMLLALCRIDTTGMDSGRKRQYGRLVFASLAAQ
jgi:hypothetical protein